MIPAGLLGSLSQHHIVASKATFHTLATATRQKATTVVVATLLHRKGRGVFTAVKDSYKQVFVAYYRKTQQSILRWLFTTGGVAETEVRTFLDICPKRSGTLLHLGPG